MAPPTQREMELGLELQELFLGVLKKLQGGSWDGAQTRIAVAVSVALGQNFPMLSEVERLSIVVENVKVEEHTISIDAVAIAGELLRRGLAPVSGSIPPTDPAPPLVT